jgi:hypothetical protein
MDKKTVTKILISIFIYFPQNQNHLHKKKYMKKNHTNHPPPSHSYITKIITKNQAMKVTVLHDMAAKHH